jgi:hypothetical protein
MSGIDRWSFGSGEFFFTPGAAAGRNVERVESLLPCLSMAGEEIDE